MAPLCAFLATNTPLAINYGYVVHQNDLVPPTHAALTLHVGLDEEQS
jgi:hypothetical protein